MGDREPNIIFMLLIL